MKKLLLDLTVVNFMYSLIFLFSQCTKDVATIKEEETIKGIFKGSIVLSQTELDIVPYVINDSIVLKDSLGNSETLKVSGRNIHFFRMYKDGRTNLPSSDYYDIERLFVSLSNNNNYNISIELSAPIPLYCLYIDSLVNKNLLEISINPASFDSFNSFGGFIDTNKFYYMGITGFLIQFHDTITIVNKTFTSVYELVDTRSYSTSNYIRTVYYNKFKGIVGFRYKKGVCWYLDN